jgi:DNA (cytosine-5)-methyltransferase 1
VVIDTLRSHPRPGSNSVGAIVISRRGREDGGSDELEEELSPALRTGGGGSSVSQIVFDPAQVTSATNRSNPQPGDPCHPLAAGAHAPAIAGGMAVRRLTPRECERLQGFPDDYTLIPYRGKPAADGPRYKAGGNSMAVPVMRWIGERIEKISKMVDGETIDK